MGIQKDTIPASAILKTIMEMQMDSVLIIDTCGNIIMANDIFKDWTGKHIEELPTPLKGILTISINLYPSQQGSKIFTMDGYKYVIHTKYIIAEQVHFGFVVYLLNVTSQDILESKLSQYIERENMLADELNALQKSEAKIKNMVSKSKAMEKILEIVYKIAGFDTNVLILGETGVGKSLVAKTIHQLSRRAKYPLIEISCGSISENLLESELFGYLPGAFTGANKKGKRGLIECAEGSTLFLDEVAELPMHLQVKLLDVIQNRRIKKIGANEFIPVNIRLITATNKDLGKMVDDGAFREDLFYRINVMPIHIPPLRERKEDIPALMDKFIEDLGLKCSHTKILSPDVKKRLLTYDWPGNIRELENVLERAFITSSGTIINKDSLPDYINDNQNIRPKSYEDNIIIKAPMPLKLAREILEKKLFRLTFQQVKSTVEVGQMLGVDQSTASRKIRKYLNTSL